MLANHGYVTLNEGAAQAALPILEGSLALSKRVLPADHPDIAARMGGLASADGALGDNKQSAALHKEALDFKKRVLPADHPGNATSMHNLDPNLTSSRHMLRAIQSHLTRDGRSGMQNPVCR